MIQTHLPREIVAGFEPLNALPESRKLRPLKAKKPKKFKTDKPEHKDGQRSGDNARGHKPTGKNRRHTGNNTSANPYGNSDGNNASRRRIKPAASK